MLNFKCMRCKYLFTDEQLPISPWKQTKEQKSIDPDNEKELGKILTEVTKNVKCPKCQSTAYLTGIGEKKDFEIDLTSEPLVQLVKGAIELVKNKREVDISKEYFEYAQGIIDILIHNPGKLVYFADPDLIKEAETAVNIIWDNVDTEELFTTIHSDLMVGMTIDYIRRAIKLKPTFLSVKPDNMVAAYFNNAIEAWLFGLNSASLILCFSIIESLLKQKYPTLLYKSDKVLKSFKEIRENERTIEEFIDHIASKDFIDNSIRQMIHDIRKLRNRATHKLKPITSDEAYTAIMDTKKVIEQLLK